MSPQLLEELLGEISSLASVYHKPEETFVGRGRIGIDTVQKKGIEYVYCSNKACRYPNQSYRLSDDRAAAQKALQTVAIGQQAENLLDFSDADGTEDGQQPSGLAATTMLTSTPAAANLLAGTSSNPLDDLVSIFGNASLSAPTTQPQSAAPLGGFGLGGAPSPLPPQTPSVLQAVSPPTQQSGQEDLLGLF